MDLIGLSHAPAVLPGAAVTWAGWQRKNATVPVGVGAPVAGLTVAVSVTDVPRWLLAVFGLDVVATGGVTGCTVVCAEPLAVPFNVETTPCNVARVRGSVVPVPGIAGFAGTFFARSVKLTMQVRLASAPFAGPNVIVDCGVSWTSPDAASGAPTVNTTFAHGVVAAAPTALRTSKMPGSRLPARQSWLALSAQAGVTNSEVSRTFSVSLGGVDWFTMMTLAPNVTPTVTVIGHVGVLLPPIPASALGMDTPSKRIPTTPSTANIFPAASPLPSR